MIHIIHGQANNPNQGKNVSWEVHGIEMEVPFGWMYTASIVSTSVDGGKVADHVV